MKKLIGLSATLALPLMLAACPGDDTGTTAADTNGDASDTDATSSPTGGSADETATGDVPAGCVGPDGPRAEVPLVIDGDMQLTCDQVWVLTGITFVNGGTLTIDPGTIVAGGAGSALVIEKDATIDARGTEDAPIVMTAITALDGQAASGDWGGLALLGTAPVNLEGGSGTAEGFATDPPTYGGDDDAHSCGTLSYLRVEWAGDEVSPGNELNGITFFACGSGTTVDHVQVHMGFDDGIEAFGGGFDASYVIISGAADDSFDFDQGFAGTIDFAFALQAPTIGNNCLEWSNQGSNFTASPLTSPTVNHLTCVGSGAGGDSSNGVTLKEGTQATIHNSIFANLTNDGVVLANAATQAQAELGNISFAGSHFCDTATFAVDVAMDDPDPAGWMSADFEAWLLADGGAANGTNCGLTDATFGAPDITPATSIPGDGGFAGAVDAGGDNWTVAPWTNYAF